MRLPGAKRLRMPVFASRGFILLWIATAISSFGDWMGFVAVNLFIFQLTGSATALAGGLIVSSLPNLLVGPVAGVVVDRFRRRHVMIAANLIAAMAFAGMPFAQNIWQLYALGVMARLATSFLNPAQRSLLPDLVGTDHVLSANAALSGVGTVTMIAGPALAGMLSSSAGVGIALGIDALTFVAAAGLVAGITGELPRTRHAAEHASAWDEALLGLRYGMHHARLRVLLMIGGVSAIAGAVLVTIEVVYVVDFLGGGDNGYGVLLSVAGVGALIASLTAAKLSARWGQVTVYATCVLLTGLFYFPYANVHILPFVILWAGVHTVPWILVLILTDTLVQQWTPEAMRGRMFSLLQMQRSAGQIVAALALAPLVDWWGPVAVMNLAGIIYTLVGVYALRRIVVLRGDPPAAAPGLSPA